MAKKKQPVREIIWLTWNQVVPQIRQVEQHLAKTGRGPNQIHKIIDWCEEGKISVGLEIYSGEYVFGADERGEALLISMGFQIGVV